MWDDEEEKNTIKREYPLFKPLITLDRESTRDAWYDLRYSNIVRSVSHKLVELMNSEEPQLDASILHPFSKIGISITMQTSYMHPRYKFHTDVPSNPDDYAKELKKKDTAYDLYPLTLIAYFMEDVFPSSNPAFGTTVVKCNESESDVSLCQVGYCPRLNGSVGIFPGWIKHAVAPNPGIVRFAAAKHLHIQYKKMASGKALDWKFVEQILKEVVGRSEQFDGVIYDEHVAFLDSIIQNSEAA